MTLTMTMTMTITVRMTITTSTVQKVDPSIVGCCCCSGGDRGWLFGSCCDGGRCAFAVGYLLL